MTLMLRSYAAVRPFPLVSFLSVSAELIGEDVLSISQRKQRPHSLGAEFLLRSAASSSGPEGGLTPSPEDELDMVKSTRNQRFSKLNAQQMLFWPTWAVRSLMASLFSL